MPHVMNSASLTPWKWGKRAIRQPTLHVMNPTSLTSCKVKEDGNSSAHAACDESDITYSLKAKVDGKSSVRQPTLHAMNQTTLTHWKVKGQGSLSAHAAPDESNITYSLKGEGGGQFVSPRRMQ